jgi:hypothetical protein
MDSETPDQEDKRDISCEGRCFAPACGLWDGTQECTCEREKRLQNSDLCFSIEGLEQGSIIPLSY